MLKSLPTPDRADAARLRRMRTSVAGVFAGVFAVVAVLTVSGCSHFTDVAPPSNIVDPGTAASQEAAVGMYTGALYKAALAFAGNSGLINTSFAAVSGLFSDEFAASAAGSDGDYDTHHITAQEEVGAGPYEGLNAARIAADQAITNLTAHAATTPASYRAEMHALKGYIYVMISELYCSGIPFSYLVPGGNLVYGTAESKTQMLDDALTQFDSALTLGADSSRIVQFAAVGKGRAYLDLGAFDSAAAAVASVSTAFVYQFSYSTTQLAYENYWASQTAPGATLASVSLFMSDREGSGHGINYVSANDPRTASFSVGGRPIPSKYPTGSTSMVLASGIEARLIEAEAALHDHDVTTWTTLLNTLRATGSGTPMAALTSDSTTTASDSIRIDVMMRERALWLYGTGHRQGDMRRLVALYQRQPADVYPAGIQPYLFVPESYLPTTNIPAPLTEQTNNLNYHGCINTDA